MKTVAVTKIGRLNDADPDQRGRIELVDFPEHELEPEDVRIRVAYAAICGSDPHVAEGFFDAPPPIGLGHELSGVVEALGERAHRNGLRVGDRVAGNFLRFCGTCHGCRSGNQQFCEFVNEYNRPGMAETVTWHESQVYRLPGDVSLLEGCLLEPTAVAVRIVDKTELKLGETAVVCGGGPIGQLALQLLRKRGATSITMIEPIAARREMALRHGAHHVIDPLGEDQKNLADTITGGRGFDVVVDASGSTRAVGGLLEIAARGGRLVYGAMYPQGFALPVDLSRYLYFKELSLTGVFVHPYVFPRAVNMLSELELVEFTQAVFPIDRAAEAFDAHMSGAFAKVIVQCNDDDTLDQR